MSQVIRKFENSGKIEQSTPELFERSGVGKYNKADYIAGLYRNIPIYLQNAGLSGERAEAFKSSVNQFIEGIKNGTITMKGDGTFNDSTGTMSSTGKFDKNWIGRTKNTTNNAFNLVGDFALDYMNQMTPYTEPAATPKSKFRGSDFLKKAISKEWYGGNEIDMNNWFENRTDQERNALTAQIMNSADYNQLYNDYDWTDTGVNSVEDLQRRMQGFGTAIGDNTLDNTDYNTFAALGGSDFNSLFKRPEAPVTQQQAKVSEWETKARAAGATTPEAIAAYVEGEKRKEGEANQKIITDNEEAKRIAAQNAYFSNYQKTNPFKNTMPTGYIPEAVDYSLGGVEHWVARNYGGDVNAFLNKALGRESFKDTTPEGRKRLANNLDYAINKLGLSFPDAGDGYVAVPSTFDFNNYSTVTYNPTSRQYKETSMLANDVLRKLANSHYNESLTSKKEKGGIMRFQFGGAYDATGHFQRINAERTKAEKPKEVNVDPNSDRTPEQQKAGARTVGVPMTEGSNMDINDKLRLGAAAGDILSAISAYVPGYGTAVSLGTGLASTTANLVADINDKSTSKWDVARNLGLGLGSDLIGLVPGIGMGAKTGKIVKGIGYILPTATAAWSAMSNGTNYINASKKLMSDPKNMTVDDWRTLGEGLQILMGASRYASGRGKAKAFSNQNVNTEKYATIRTKSGKAAEVTPEQLDQIKHAKGFKEQNRIFSSIHKDETLQGEFKQGAGRLKVWKQSPEVESKTRTTVSNRNLANEEYIPWGYNAQGEAKKWSNDWIQGQLAGFGNKKVNLHLFETKNPNYKKTGQTASKTSETPKTKSESPKRLALPAKGQTSERVFTMGAGREPIVDKTNPNNLKKPSSYTDMAVRVGAGVPAQSPSGQAVRVARTANSVLDQFIPRNLPATIPASRNAQRVVRSQTVVPTQRLDQFIESKIPGGRQFGNHRAKTERDMRETFHPVVEKEQNSIWDQLTNTPEYRNRIIQTKSTPNVPTAPTAPAELFTETQKRVQRSLKDSDTKKERSRKNTLPHKEKKRTKKTSKDDKVTKKALGGLIPMFQNSGIVGKAAPAKLNVSIMPEDVLSLGRMVGGLVTNNEAAKVYKSGLKPTLLDTFENTVPIQGNLQAKTTAEQQAGSLQSLAARPRTSDASLQLAGELEVANQANQIRAQGDLQDADMFYKSRSLGQQESDAAKARRVEVGNQNRASMNAIGAAKKQIDSAKITANYQQVLAPFLGDIENQFRQNSAMKKQFDMDTARDALTTTYSGKWDAANAAMETNRKAYLAANKGKEEGWTDSESYKQYVKDTQSLGSQFNTEVNNIRGSQLKFPWLFGKAPSTASKIPSSAKGSKLSYRERAMLQRSKDFNKRLSDDNKLMHRDIMEAKREHNKLIMNMSSLTASLIKRGMNL